MAQQRKILARALSDEIYDEDQIRQMIEATGLNPGMIGFSNKSQVTWDNVLKAVAARKFWAAFKGVLAGEYDHIVELVDAFEEAEIERAVTTSASNRDSESETAALARANEQRPPLETINRQNIRDKMVEVASNNMLAALSAKRRYHYGLTFVAHEKHRPDLLPLRFELFDEALSRSTLDDEQAQAEGSGHWAVDDKHWIGVTFDYFLETGSVEGFEQKLIALKVGLKTNQKKQHPIVTSAIVQLAGNSKDADTAAEIVGKWNAFWANQFTAEIDVPIFPILVISYRDVTADQGFLGRLGFGGPPQKKDPGQDVAASVAQTLSEDLSGFVCELLDIEDLRLIRLRDFETWFSTQHVGTFLDPSEIGKVNAHVNNQLYVAGDEELSKRDFLRKMKELGYFLEPKRTAHVI